MNHLSLLLAGLVATLLAGCHSDSEGAIAPPDIEVGPEQRSAQELDTEPELDGARVAAELPCEAARLLKVRTVERSEARLGGPVAPAADDETRRAGLATRTIYYLSLDCGGKTYVASVQGGTPGFQPDDLEAAAALHLRTEGGKILLKVDDGMEFEVALAAIPSAGNAPP